MKHLGFLLLIGASIVASRPKDPVFTPTFVEDVSLPEPPAPEPSASAPAPVPTGQIGVYETKYAIKTNRARNVERAAAFFKDGITLTPGETLSFNAIVGPRDQHHGFAKAPVIIDGEMTDGDGGGVCQVSSTLHAAARAAHLTIAERTPHTRPSAYIAPGLDATVVYPDKDLKIRNDSEFPVTITFSIRPDPASKWLGILSAEVTGRPTSAAAWQGYTYKTGASGQSFSRRSKEEEDGGCPKQVQKGADGRIVWSTITFTDGSTATWRSVYPATDEIWHVCPGQPAPWEEAAP